MILISTKIRIIPTPEQEQLFWKSAGVARWAYNSYLGINENLYRTSKATGYQKSISEGAYRKLINSVKKEMYPWLYDVSSNIFKQAVKDAASARERWFKGLSGKPKFKAKHKTKPSFYVNYESLKKVSVGFKGEKLGQVKLSYPLPKLPKGIVHYSDPRITYDGKYWYLSVGYPVAEHKVQLTDDIIGIDLGIKELAVLSNGKVYPNINRTKRVRLLKKRLRRQKRCRSRRFEHNVKERVNNRPMYERPLRDCKNYQRQSKRIRTTERALFNIRSNYLHQTTTEIVKTKPFAVVLEDLNIRGMMKNKHLSSALSEQKLYEFRRQMTYKCKLYGIKVFVTDRWYPSSKTCSNCGYHKKDLKLSERTYHCPVCGLNIDRDLNAAINLAKLPIATGKVKPAES